MNALSKQTIKRVLVVAPHPDDAEIAIGGMIISLCKHGIDVHVADLTNGEPTPHGTVEIRKRESERASSIMGIQGRYCLQMPNRYLENTLENRNRLACIIRKIRPQIMFMPVKPDEHPDHLAASDIVHGARFEAKLHKTDMPGEPHWVPTLIGYYSPHRKLYDKPNLIFDISDVWDDKAEAISSYESQLKNTPPEGLNFLEKTKAVNGYFGQSIDRKYAEPLKLFDPLNISLINGVFGFFII